MYQSALISPDPKENHLKERNRRTIYNRIKSLVNEELKQYFRPEFLNRLDDVVVFAPLTALEIAEVTPLALNEVRERLGERGVDLKVSTTAKSEIVREGYDPDFGARPLRRVIERRIENHLAKRVLAGEFEMGDIIVVDFTDGIFSFSSEPGAKRSKPVEAEVVEV